MPKYHPYHSDESFGPGQSFVDAAHSVTEEELARPRYGRPVRPTTPTLSPPTSETPPEKDT